MMREAFGPRGRRGGPRGPHGHGPHGHGPHGHGHGGPRAGRGDVRSAILVLLSEGEMHGYQIIREIEDRSSGTWKPSPGSVYPTLQMLADEGLVEVAEAGSRKSYHLTEEGKVAAKKAAERPLPWKTPSAEAINKAAGLPRAGAELAQAIGQVATSGTPKQTEATIETLKDARRQIYAILAEE
ncbi:PadR family transcriptional regulator [Ancrocorticia populi]|uniref:PadR family transcriptional regulator n=1 Tax=Ancrocorticia populi TaxID=2175228 RepID=UPI003F993FFE